jgi:hypothetical protein
MMRRIALWMAKNVLGCRHARMAGFRRGGENGVEVYVVGDILLSDGALLALKFAHDEDERVEGGRWTLETVDSAVFVRLWHFGKGGGN